MNDSIFALILKLAGLYACLGFCVAVVFVSIRSGRFDPAAASGTWGFRLLIIPGIVALWPVILAKVLAVRRGRGAEGGAEWPVSPESLRRRHALAFVALLVAGPLLFAAALIWRAPRLEALPAADAAAAVIQQSNARTGIRPHP